MDTHNAVDLFKQEGFTHVFIREDKADTVYPPHSHNGKVSIYIITGSVSFDFDGKQVTVSTGERFDVPVGKKHSAVVGSQGCKYIVAEMITGDS